MTFLNPNPSGWSFGSQFKSAEANLFGTQFPYALDGLHGGYYAADAIIEIAGTHGLKVSAPLTATGASTFNTIAVGSDASIAGNSVLNTLTTVGAVACGTTLGVTGATTLSGAATLSSTLGVTGLATLTGGFHSVGGGLCDNGLIIGGGLGVTSGSVTIGSGTSGNSIAAEVVLSGAGRIRKRVTNAANADTTYDVTTLDVLNTRNSTAARTYTLADTGANVGSEIEITSWDASWAHVIKNAGGATIWTMPVLSGVTPGRAIFRWCDNGSGVPAWHYVGA